MKVTSVCAVGISLFAAQVAGDSFEQNLQQQLEQLKAEVVAQREVIEELKVAPRHLEAEEKLSIAEKIANLEESSLGLGGALDSAWLCLCGALVMFMHAGFAMLETGCCRAKNASNVLMKNLVNVCCGTLGWWSLGWAFAYGDQHDNGFIGTDGFFGWNFYTRDASSGVITPVECTSDGCQSTMLSWFFQWAFCTAGATIVSGAVAERVLMIVLWSGTLSSIGFFVLKKTGLLRISEEVEEIGMDTHHHSPPKAYNMGEVSSPSKSMEATV
eukprot:Skav224412  [mRNA]  locus=scaffold657:120855:123004:+ [translate_table: standard]